MPSAIAFDSGAALSRQQRRALTACRRAKKTDLLAIVWLQTRFQPQFLWKQPGAAILRVFYSFLFGDPRGLFLVSENKGSLTGFVLGHADPAGLSRSFEMGALLSLAAIASCAATHPRQLTRLFKDIRAVSRIKHELADAGDGTCELFTIAVHPLSLGQGHGMALISAFVEAAAASGGNRVRVRIGSNDHDMSSFNRKLGFSPSRSFQASDARWLDEYVLRF